MSTGIQITGGHGNQLNWNLTMGMDTGISLQESSENILNSNIIISKEALGIFGQEFKDVAVAVHESRDVEALAALASVIEAPTTSALGWSTLLSKFGLEIGSFKASMLNGILSSAAWDALKAILKQHGVELGD